MLTAIFVAVGCSSGGNHTQIRVLQTSPDETAVDVLIDGKSIAGSVGYAIPTSFTSVRSGSRHLQVEPTGTSTPVIDETVTLNSGTNYTLITDNFASAITPVLLTDDNTAPGSGDIKLRFVNAGAGAGDVDIYVLAPGTTPPGNPPTISNLALGSASSYQSLAAGTYEIFVTIAGTTFIYVDSGPRTFNAAQNRTIVLVSDLANGFKTVTLPDLN
ncbi:MAG: DUF4397 domain-containing protein [Acidobacteriia bacterium]|nr:DUF4397 domain-containing protein [Terriglobia bacterium]